MKHLLPLSPLLMAAGILLAGNGLQGTLIALRSAHEGFDASLIGLMGTGYYAGFLVSCLTCTRLIRAVGHIRVFSGLAAIAASSSLTMVLWLDPVVWIFLRFISGFCFAGLFMVIESWLNASVDNQHRASTLSVYRMVDLAAVTGSQFLLPLFGAYGFAIFAIAAIMTCLSLVPISLVDRSSPKPPEEFRFSIKSIWAISPIACFGCITIGLTNSTFRLMGPIYASEIGLDTAGVATFMSAGIIGGAVLQLPLGWMSDRLDRRWVLVIATLGAAASGFLLSYAAGTSHSLAITGIFMFGAFALPLYSLSAAHANDHANPGQYVIVAAGLSFFFSLGAMIGPLMAAQVLKVLGPDYFFTYTSVVHLIFVVVTLWRLSVRATPDMSAKKRYATLLRTSPFMYKLAHRGKRKP
ncbi:MAG: MFS transporter [Anderseniella sp.]